jgi:hypothetical protein
MKMKQCSETSAHKIQAQGIYPEKGTQHTEHGESLKSRNQIFINEPVSNEEVHSSQK